MLITEADSTSRRNELLSAMADRLRRDSIEATDAAGSGHPTSSLSCAEIMSVLFFDAMRFDPNVPYSPSNDEFVLSKGHAAPVLWATYHQAGMISRDEMLSLRDIDSRQEGHPTPRNPWVKVATGSLGQGLPMGLGMAWAARRENAGSRVYVLLGDGETAEGSNWEAAALASHEKMDNLTAVVDVNRLGQSAPTMLEHDASTYEARFAAFGWETKIVDGHDPEKLSTALAEMRNTQGRPQVVLAMTKKGAGVSQAEDKEGLHGKALDEPSEALEEIHPEDSERLELRVPHETEPARVPEVPVTIGKPEYEIGKDVSPREAYGHALLEIAASSEDIIALDGDVKNSTKTQAFFDQYPQRAVECFIAEQNMVGMAIGLGKRGFLPYVATFAAFLTRAFDQLRMAGISFSDIKIAGTHAGVSIGPDGPTQMGLEDLAMFRSLPGSTVLYPSDAVATHAATTLVGPVNGIAYQRLTRGKLPTIYADDTDFEIGGSKVWGETDHDRVTLVGAGVTLHECLKAQHQLETQKIKARVIDLFSVKPVDVETLARCVAKTGAIVLVEDHYPEGGLGEAVLSALEGREFKWRHLAVREVPRSGKPDELLEKYGISASHIVEAAREVA
ncbi:MAG: transketolase [Opitutales bacterium]